MVKKGLFLVLLALVFTGCRSDIYYQNRAVEHAREYLLENCSELSDNDANFVRYNAPLLLHAPVLHGSSSWSVQEKMRSELKQVCVAWMIPGKKDLYMVFGVSGARMDFWYPNRILIRSYDKYEPVMIGAIKIARIYVANNFFDDLDVVESNRVRFSFPYLLRTKFELNLDPAGIMSAEEYEEAEKGNSSRIQYSLVWKFGKRNMVLAGLADHGFVNWDVSLAQIIDNNELEENTVAVVMTPADALKELPQEELQATLPAENVETTEMAETDVEEK